jgi:MOSC domain-containing protein YiiM
MNKTIGRLVSVHIGKENELEKIEQSSVAAKLDGFIGDRHRGYSRVAYEGDTEPEGTVRRNNRQWTGVSVEELAEIQARMDLREPLTAETLGANICVSGIPNFSQLAKGDRLIFPSGATLIVENYNPPCSDMSENIAALHMTKSGEPVRRLDFCKQAKRIRGLVGSIDVPGIINTGDKIMVQHFKPSHFGKE